MHTEVHLNVWIVEPHEGLRGLLRDFVTTTRTAADVLAEEEFRRRIERGSRPDAVMIDGSAFLRLAGRRSALEGTLRTLIVTGRHPSELPASVIGRPSVRFLRKPFALGALERGLAWLGGDGDDSWSDRIALAARDPGRPGAAARPSG